MISRSFIGFTDIENTNKASLKWTMFIQFTVRFLSKGLRLHRYIFPGYDTDLSVPSACERTKIYKWWVAIIIEHALRYGKTGNNKERKMSWTAMLRVLPPTSNLSWLDKAKGCFHYPRKSNNSFVMPWISWQRSLTKNTLSSEKNFFCVVGKAEPWGRLGIRKSFSPLQELFTSKWVEKTRSGNYST